MNELKRVCKQCNIEKPITEFIKKVVNGTAYYGYKCKTCINAYKREKYKQDETLRIKNRARANAYRLEHKEEIKEKRAEYFKEYRKKYYKEHKEYYIAYKKTDRYKEQQQEYRNQNKEHIAQQNKKYKQKNHDEILEKRKKWDKKYRDNHKQERREWLETNKDLINKYKREYHQNRVKTDPLYKFEKQIRGTIISSFKRKKYIKNNHTYEIIGLSNSEFIDYLKETYKNIYGYEWDNKEPVHIDHIIPLSIADTEDEIIRLCHYTNLQLLKAKDNLSKRDNLEFKIDKK